MRLLFDVDGGMGCVYVRGVYLSVAQFLYEVSVPIDIHIPEYCQAILITLERVQKPSNAGLNTVLYDTIRYSTSCGQTNLLYAFYSHRECVYCVFVYPPDKYLLR